MKREESKIEDVIIDHIQGDHSDETSQRVMDWIDETPENMEKLKQVNLLYNLSHDLDKRYNHNESLENILTQNRLNKYLKGISLYKRLLAACVILLIGVTSLFVVSAYLSEYTYVHIETEVGNRTHTILPDGTSVFLNSRSSIIYSCDGGIRSVILDGEGYFDVASTGDPFEVISKNQKVVVTGTQFNIEAYSEDPYITTTLIEGSIELNIADKILKMTPNQQVRVDSKGRYVFNKGVQTTDCKAWIEDKMILRDQSFASICMKLERRYQIRISFNDSKLAGYKFTGIFKKEGLPEIISILCDISNATYYKDNDGYHIEPKKLQ
ncbi:DUF4974 domain-containing protein [Halosquirtibacter laminarini]|uniref:DUF4974 domain-containing protein n=1 Tax=Halosquirtibacter laminarini TaxID=3374600 RepID=A0AC61NNC5_9BACT|nr:DUF4974 domain-containing protein [Prolixibacteraceae bacterium]